MRKIAEIRRDLNNKIAEVKGIDLSNEEASKKGLDELNALVRELNVANEVEAAEQKAADEKLGRMERVAGRPFSITKFLRELSSGKGLTEIEKDVAEMGAEEYRRLGLSQQGVVLPSAFLRASSGQNYTTAADGGNLIETMPFSYVNALKERLIVKQLGATVVTDLVGNVPFISAGSFTGAWGAEGAQAQKEKIAFSKVTLTPHRNWIAAAVSKDLLRQTSLDVDRLIMDRILDRHAELIDQAAFAGSGSNGQPTGILNTTGIGSVAGGTNGAAVSWANMVALETAINASNANRGKMAYATNAKVMGALKTTEKAQGTARFVCEDGKNVNGYPIEWSNLVPSNLTKGTGTGLSAVVFGNWQDLVVAQWGGIDIVVDPYTSALLAEINITLNAWNDVAVVEPKSFAAIKDVIA